MAIRYIHPYEAGPDAHELDRLVQEHDVDIESRREILNALKYGEPSPRCEPRVRLYTQSSSVPDRRNAMVLSLQLMQGDSAEIRRSKQKRRRKKSNNYWNAKELFVDLPKREEATTLAVYPSVHAIPFLARLKLY